MNNLDNASISGSSAPFRELGNMQEQRNPTEEIADWVVANIPWTVAVPEWPDFHDRWPLLKREDLAAVEDELHRRCAALESGGSELDAVAETLTGRPTYWAAAADWLTLNPGGSICDPEFFRLFSRLSRAELILAAVEHKRSILRGCRG